MSNHFHLFLKVENKILFEKGIKNFLISYAKSVNKKYDRVGSLFQGRYKAAEIDTDSYFTRIITYIHQNPLAAGIVSNLEDYQHSSYNDYLSDENTIIAKSKVIDWFNGREEFIKAHK
jgi:REP element-mobilizing transposase RayT